MELQLAGKAEERTAVSVGLKAGSCQIRKAI
jgi:hypothetical protein